MPTLVVGMRRFSRVFHMSTTSVGMASNLSAIRTALTDRAAFVSLSRFCNSDSAGGVMKIMAHEVTLITGDGVGPELAEAARRCVDATGVAIHWDVQEAGLDVMARCGTPLPEATMQSIRRTRCALKAPITTPVGTGFRSINVHLRQELGLFACIRPCKHYPGVRTFFSDRPVDLVIVRENTEDLYAGIEFEAAQPSTGELIDYINKISPQRRIRSGRAETGISIKPISISGTERIVRCAFEYACQNARRNRL